MVALAALLAFACQGVQTPPKPFKATAQLGAPFTMGYEQVIIGTTKKIDTGTLRVLTLSSADLSATYPNTSENIVAGAGEKLLILHGALKNPSVVDLPVSGSGLASVRFWDGQGKGTFKFAGFFDPQSHNPVHGTLRKGQSAPFDCVIRIPALFDPIHVGLYHENKARIAWYDLKSRLGKMQSAFSPDGFTLTERAKAAKNQSFDFDLYRMKVLGASEVSTVGGVEKGSQPLWIVSVEVTNAMLLPARWGWQYTAPELVMQDGATVAGMRDLIDKATDKTWSGDLPVGATMTAQFIFRPSNGQIPTAFRLTLSSSGRKIEVPL